MEKSTILNPIPKPTSGHIARTKENEGGACVGTHGHTLNLQFDGNFGY